MSQGIALEGMRLVKDNLPRVVADPNDVAARAHMMSAAAMGAVAFQKGLGAIHSISHPVGAIYDTHHGTTNAVVMPMVLQFNRAEIADKLALAAKYLEIDGGFDGFYDFVVKFRRELGVPETLADLGVGRDRFDEIAAMAVEDPSAGGNPVKLTVDNVRQLLDTCV
jgi:alcohol dehydrogenase